MLDGYRLGRAIGILHHLAPITHPLLSESRVLVPIRISFLECLLLDQDGVDTRLEEVSLVASHLCGVVASPRSLVVLLLSEIGILSLAPQVIVERDPKLF